jgi:hypothetical protein
MTDKLTHAREVKARHETELMALPGVISVGVGLQKNGKKFTEDVAIVVMVRKKQRAGSIPAEIEGVPVDVQVSGEINAL